MNMRNKICVSVVLSVLMVVAIIPAVAKHIFKMVPSEEELNNVSAMADYMVEGETSGINVYDYWTFNEILKEDTEKTWAKNYKFETEYDSIETDDVTGATRTNINVYIYSSNYFGSYKFSYPVSTTKDGTVKIEMSMKAGKHIDFRWYKYVLYILVGIPAIYGLLSLINDKKTK